MRAYGSDRLRMNGDRAILFCLIPKNWTARVPRTLTSSEHPGTAVLWEGELYEVVEALQTGNAVRYELEPWRDEHIIRYSEGYDEATETVRAEQNRLGTARTRKRTVVNLTGMLAGYLPAPVQNELASELGVFPNRFTILSGVLSLVIAALSTTAVVGSYMRQQGALVPGDPEAPAAAASGEVPMWLVGVALYLTFETIIRFFFVLSQNRPIGSVPGFIGYTIYWLVSPRRAKMVSPFEVPRGERLFTLPPEEHVVLSDKVRMWGPFLTLLTPVEQKRLMETVGFDYRREAVKVAAFILVFCLVGVVSSVASLREEPRLSAFVSLVVALGLGGEQALRLAAFGRGPAGSVLGALVRPFVRGLLERR
ncbi:MAG: hypothetical protein WA208_16275 [Thermoanaerobaculia bacterium]